MNYPKNIEIKYKKIFPIFIFISSIFILSVSFVIGFSINTITGLVLLLLGILMLTRNIAIITPNEIQMMNLLGITVKTYAYTPDKIVITNNSIYVNDKKVISTSWADVNLKEVREFISPHEN